jgi:antitoxin (DNA-binding transcriptional repressor) of toxin-antitoxin stability system
MLDNVASCDHILEVQTVGIRELKSRLSEVLRAVKAGERFLVTDRGVVIAELAQPQPSASDPRVPPGLAGMAERGDVRLGAPNDPAMYRAVPALQKTPSSVQALLDDERGER